MGEKLKTYFCNTHAAAEKWIVRSARVTHKTRHGISGLFFFAGLEKCSFCVTHATIAFLFHILFTSDGMLYSLYIRLFNI